MKKVILILILLALLFGCEQNNAGIEPLKESVISSSQTSEAIEVVTEIPDIKISLSTEKDVYHSNEIMNITINLESNKKINDVELKVYGIYSIRNRLDKTKIINLKQGNNIVLMDYIAPSCNTCSGINPGTYQINAEILLNTRSLAKTEKNIEITQ